MSFLGVTHSFEDPWAGHYFNFINWLTQYKYDSFKTKSKSFMSQNSSMSNATHNIRIFTYLLGIWLFFIGTETFFRSKYILLSVFLKNFDRKKRFQVQKFPFWCFWWYNGKYALFLAALSGHQRPFFGFFSTMQLRIFQTRFFDAFHSAKEHLSFRVEKLEFC